MNNQNKAKDIVEELNILYSLFENKKNIFYIFNRYNFDLNNEIIRNNRISMLIQKNPIKN